MAMACKPEEQKRFTVIAAVETGGPACSAETRAMLWPCTPGGWRQPRITSSISFGSSWGVLRRTSLMQWAARSSGRVMLKEPRNDFARPVRELATTTASRMLVVGRSSLVEHYGMVKEAIRLQLFVYLGRRRYGLPRPVVSAAGRVPRVRHGCDEIR